MIYKEIEVCDLSEELWSGGLDNYERIKERGIEDCEIQEMIETYFPDDASITEINDFFWFNDDEIFSYFGIKEEEEEEEVEETEEE